MRNMNAHKVCTRMHTTLIKAGPEMWRVSCIQINRKTNVTV